MAIRIKETKLELFQCNQALQEEIAQLKDQLTVARATTSLASGLNKLARDYSLKHLVTTRVANGKVEAFVNGSWSIINPEN